MKGTSVLIKMLLSCQAALIPEFEIHIFVPRLDPHFVLR